jgi:hypothetical protein
MSNTVRPRAAARAKLNADKAPDVVDFDLDAYEAEATGEPFKFRLGGETYRMASPEEADWQVQMAAFSGDVPATEELLRQMLGDDFPRFEQHRLSARRLRELTKRCAEHFGVETGEGPAS